MEASGVDLARLNEAEREALELLAQGHTAKSIAALTGRSVGAVNERLREARRKTGVGSSRELARLLWAQKSRDEEIGVAAAAAPEATKGAEAAPEVARRSRRKGAAVMAVLAIGGLAAAAMLLQLDPQSVPQTPAAEETPLPDDPLLGNRFARPEPIESDPHRLYALVRSEDRDPAWAGPLETTLRDFYETIPGVGKPGNELRIICAATICEVAGTLSTPKGDAPGTSRDTIDASMSALQGIELRKFAEKLGMEVPAMSFGGDPSNPSRSVFVAYWTKADH